MLSRLLRYAPVAADLDPAVGVLDVGCGRLGLGCVLDGARFAGQDVQFPGPVTPAMFGVRSGTGRFPWAEGAFDTVVCVSVIERLPPAERGAFVAECARVAARRVLISCATEETDVLKAARFGDGPRRGFALTRVEAREPLVDPRRFDASTAAALECVQCGTRLRLETAVGLRCVGCGCIPARDATGTWDLTR